MGSDEFDRKTEIVSPFSPCLRRKLSAARRGDVRRIRVAKRRIITQWAGFRDGKLHDEWIFFESEEKFHFDKSAFFVGIRLARVVDSVAYGFGCGRNHHGGRRDLRGRNFWCGYCLRLRCGICFPNPWGLKSGWNFVSWLNWRTWRGPGFGVISFSGQIALSIWWKRRFFSNPRSWESKGNGSIMKCGNWFEWLFRIIPVAPGSQTMMSLSGIWGWTEGDDGGLKLLFFFGYWLGVGLKIDRLDARDTGAPWGMFKVTLANQKNIMKNPLLILKETKRISLKYHVWTWCKAKPEPSLKTLI